MVILGGSHLRHETQMSSVWLFDTKRETFRKVVDFDDESLCFDSVHNECSQIANNIVMARVRTIWGETKLIKYVKGANCVVPIQEMPQ